MRGAARARLSAAALCHAADVVNREDFPRSIIRDVTRQGLFRSLSRELVDALLTLPCFPFFRLCFD